MSVHNFKLYNCDLFEYSDNIFALYFVLLSRNCRLELNL